MMKEDHATFGSVLGSTIWGFPKIRGYAGPWYIHGLVCGLGL